MCHAHWAADFLSLRQLLPCGLTRGRHTPVMGTALHLAHRNLPLSSWPPGLTRGESRIYNKATLHWHPWEFCNFGGSPAKPTARGGGPRALLTTRIQDSTPKAHSLWRGCFLEGHKAWSGPPRTRHRTRHSLLDYQVPLPLFGVCDGQRTKSAAASLCHKLLTAMCVCTYLRAQTWTVRAYCTRIHKKAHCVCTHDCEWGVHIHTSNTDCMCGACTHRMDSALPRDD